MAIRPPPAPPPAALPPALTPALTREARLAAKLRENLRRRKAQARGVTDGDGAEAHGQPPPGGALSKPGPND